MIVAEMLTARQFAFVNEYLVDFNGTQAALRAGYAVAGAGNTAYELLSNPEIYRAIEDRKAELAARAGLSVEWVLRQWKEIASADPNELMWNELEACRHCHGVDHQYQWTEFEHQMVVRIATEHLCGAKCEQPCTKRIPPLPIGGMGFNPHAPPAADCPVCHGDGVVSIKIGDTKRLKGSARRLYAGIKQTQHGIEVKMRDQDGALKNIAQYLGMVIDKREMAGPNGGPIPVANYSAKDLTDDQLAQIILQDGVESA